VKKLTVRNRGGCYAVRGYLTHEGVLPFFEKKCQGEKCFFEILIGHSTIKLSFVTYKVAIWKPAMTGITRLSS